ncbi:GNAT family N-acetyltransferase [Streptomyces sp. NPDC058001]|uniref:GNAT family N-acetyltransferase n=1 Tax=Streptomyces sp. NPDC058001 TaxID=3346300 RepID=UPI0036F1367D
MSTPSLSALPIRRLTPRDVTACADLSQDRGWSPEDHKWGLLLAAGTGYGIDAPDGQGLMGAAVVTAYGRQDSPDLLAIGMVLVAQRYERQGVGRRMMRHLLAEAGTTPLTLHATPNGRPLYEELGFKAVGSAEMMVGAFTAEGVDAAADTAGTKQARGAKGTGASVATRSATAEDLPAILRLDDEVFGLDRTHMITRLPAFADQLQVAEANGEIVGYAAAWPNTHHEVVGPLIARDTETAKALITSLAARAVRPLRTDIDVRHEELLTWLKERGLEPVAFNTVMVHSAPDLPGDWVRRFAPLTVAAG